MKPSVGGLALAVCVLIGHIAALPFPAYNTSDALNYVNYAYASYCVQSKITSWNCQYCVGETQGFVFTQYFTGWFYDAQAYIGYHPTRKEIIVSFRGTLPSSLKDWLSNFNYIQSVGPFKGVSVWVHNGFLKSYSEVASYIMSALMSLKAKYPTFSIVLTGHSLGGAQATVMAMDLYFNKGVTNAYVMTFGSPRVGDWTFAAAFNKAYAGRSWRVTHQKDLVPHVPPMVAPPCLYHAVGTEVWYKNDSLSQIYIADPSGEDPNGSNSIPLALSLADHLTYGGILLLGCGQI